MQPTAALSFCPEKMPKRREVVKPESVNGCISPQQLEPFGATQSSAATKEKTPSRSGASSERLRLFDTRFGAPGSHDIHQRVNCGLEQTFPVPSMCELKTLYHTYYNFGGETGTPSEARHRHASFRGRIHGNLALGFFFVVYRKGH
jgi:hypothetical protein